MLRDSGGHAAASMDDESCDDPSSGPCRRYVSRLTLAECHDRLQSTTLGQPCSMHGPRLGKRGPSPPCQTGRRHSARPPADSVCTPAKRADPSVPGRAVTEPHVSGNGAYDRRGITLGRGKYLKNRWGVVKAVGPQHEVLPGVDTGRRAPTERRASAAVVTHSPDCALHRDVHIFRSLLEVARVHASSAGMVQNGVQDRLQEICRSDGEQNERLRQAAFNSRPGRSEGRPRSQDVAEPGA
jgi:hypothetical protein